MPVRITCPHCQTDLRLPDKLSQGPAQCPRCDGAFSIRWPNGQPKSVATLTPDASDVKCEPRLPCRFCGKPLNRVEEKCPFCGERLEP